MKINDELAFARLKASIDNDDDYSFDDICNKYVNEKLLPDKFKVQICEDDWEFYDFPLNQQASEQKG